MSDSGESETAGAGKVKEMIDSGKLAVDKIVDEISLIQDGKGSGTPIRSMTANFRSKVDDAKFRFRELKQSIIGLKDEAVVSPKNLVSETAFLQSSFILKSCKYQPVATASIVTLLVALPMACKLTEIC